MYHDWISRLSKGRVGVRSDAKGPGVRKSQRGILVVTCRCRVIMADKDDKDDKNDKNKNRTR